MKKGKFSGIQRYPAVFSGIQHTLAALKFFIQSWILGDIINLFFQEKKKYYTRYCIITISTYDNKILYVEFTLSNLLYIV